MEKGTLFIVGTPIGNSEDITIRAIKTLKEVDEILCEDTRKSGSFLKKIEVSNKLSSFHSHSSDKKVLEIIDKLKSGKNLALISDAGTPGISDPSFQLTKKAREEGIKICPIPGASAFLTALSASGLPINKFLYLGFIPAKKGREKFLKEIKDFEHTVVFYESVHRIENFFKKFEEIFGTERKLLVAREMTKIYEEFIFGNILEVKEKLGKIKGEFVVIIPNEKFDKEKV